MLETLIIIGVCEISCLGVAALCWYLIKVKPKSFARRKALLEDSFDRLKLISTELLRKIDDLDESNIFEGRTVDALAAQSIKTISTNAALLSESLETIDELIKTRKLDDASKILAASAKLAEKVEHDFNHLQKQGVILKIESKQKEKR